MRYQVNDRIDGRRIVGEDGMPCLCKAAKDEAMRLHPGRFVNGVWTLIDGSGWQHWSFDFKGPVAP